MSDSKHEPKADKFHSSVNCIPVLRSYSSGEISRGQTHRTQNETRRFNLPKEITDFLSDSSPQPLDHLEPDSYSGSLRLTIETMTALIFGHQDTSDGGPTKVSVPRDPITKHPFIAPTMIKGMISNAYERLTASRFRIFSNHDEPLTYRADPAAANALVPVRLNKGYDEGNHTGTLLYGPGGARFAKVLTHEKILMENNKKKTRPLTQVKQVWEVLQHAKSVEFKAKKIDNEYIVTHVKEADEQDYLQLNTPQWVSKHNATESEYSGWFYSTTPDSILKDGGCICDGKVSERIFFNITNQKEVYIAPKVAAAYDRIIHSYSYDSSNPRTPKPEHVNTFSIDRAKYPEIAPPKHSNLLAYALLGDDGSVIELLPTQVGRRSYKVAPKALAAAQHVLPTSSLDSTSPGEQLFGFVPQEKSAEQPSHIALKGRITISNLDTQDIKPETVKQQHLHPLFKPNVNSARRFLTTRDGHTSSGRKRSDYFSEGDLLGAAAYPFSQNDLLSKDGIPKRATFTSFMNTNTIGSNVSPDSHVAHSQAMSWIPKGQKFHCTLKFEGLSTIELRILLLILSPDLLGQYADTSDNATSGYLRMGTGKPLGLGIVRVYCTKHSIYRTSPISEDHHGLVNDYGELIGCLGAPSGYLADVDLGWNCQTFIEQAQSFYRELAKTPSAKAFLRACVGYPLHQVRYMSLDENKRNNETDSKTGLPKQGRALAPRSLATNDWDAPLAVGKS